MKDKFIAVCVIAVLLAVVYGTIVWNVSFWRECRRDNSWLYCMHVLGK